MSIKKQLCNMLISAIVIFALVTLAICFKIDVNTVLLTYVTYTLLMRTLRE